MRLIRSAPGAGKTAFILREFKAALREGSAAPLRILVPTATLVRHLRHELARDGVIFAPSSVVSLNRFCTERAPDIRPVPAALLPAVVRDCLRHLRLPEFSTLLEADGLISTVIETIALFENAASTSDKLASARGLHPLGRAFSKLWHAIDLAIHERGFATRPELIRAAAASVPSGSRIWMDGFLNLSPLEEEFVTALATTCDLTITLTDVPAAGEIAEIRRFALRLGAIDHLLPGPARRPATTVVEATTMEREASEIARRVLQFHADGTPFRRIGIALRDISGYLTLLQATFERFGIPARFYFGHSLATHPVALFAEGLVAGALEGWDHETALDTFRAHPRWGRAADFDRFDFAVREAMPGHGADTLLALCDSEWLHRELSTCLRIEAWKTTLERPAAWQQRLEKLLTAQYRPGTLDLPSGHSGIAAARSHVAALHAWIVALQSAIGFFPDPDRAVTLEEFWRIASTAIANTVFQIPDDRVDVVHVMSVYEARQWDLDALLVCGMTDRDFPNRRPQNLFFPDALVGTSARQQERDEQALFESLRTRATRSLVLTYPAHDAAGKSVQPSRFLADMGTPQAAILARPEIAAPSPPGRPGRIADPALTAELVRLHRTASMSSLEDLAQCRFKFFASRTLGLKPTPDRPSDRLQARVTGTILHKALEIWQKDRTRNFVELYDEAFNAACRDQHLPPSYRLEVKRIEFRDIASRVSTTEQWAYDSSEVEVPLAIELSLGVTVGTRIDRLDIIGNDCIIVDYKSGKTTGLKQKLESETHLQGPLYALAVREQRHLNPVAVVFWAVREDEQYGWGHIPGASDAVNATLQPMPADWATAARARIEERLSDFLNGAVVVHPQDPSLCRWCDYAGACRVEQQELVAITAGSTASSHA